ncbi:MAG: hypothetical protein QF675_09605 [SAR324 cluster bacterium]|nr:hypothetical protein [SAR324 cluster bacterium]
MKLQGYDSCIGKKIKQGDRHTVHKERISFLRVANFSESGVRSALEALMLPSKPVHLSHSHGEMQGPVEFYEKVYAPSFL